MFTELAAHKLSLASLVYSLVAQLQTWINPDTGVANNFLDSLRNISDNPEIVMLLILAVFAGSHSSLAYLRPYGNPAICVTPVSSYCTISCPYLRCTADTLPAAPLTNVRLAIEDVCMIVYHYRSADATSSAFFSVICGNMLSILRLSARR